jgi:hypothetical protein
MFSFAGEASLYRGSGRPLVRLAVLWRRGTPLVLSHVASRAREADETRLDPGRDELVRLDRLVIVAAGATFLVLMAFAGRYGYQVDELHSLDMARHLQWSYVDVPILTPLLARASLSLFGMSLVGLRLWPALAAAATVIITGLLAREFGGGRAAQGVAAVGAATAPVLLGADHIFGYTAFDLLAWAGFALVVVRIGRTSNLTSWVAAGLVLGLGLLNKQTIALFAVAVVGSAVTLGARRLVLNRWFVAGAALATLFVLPNVWWQAHEGWPTFAYTREYTRENGGGLSAIRFIVLQLFLFAPIVVGVWVAGLRFLWRSKLPMWRGLALSYGLLFVVFAATVGAQSHQLAGAYFFLIAAGAVSIERWLNDRGARLALTVGLTAVTALPFVTIVLPVLPAENIGGLYGINPAQSTTVGWPEIVRTVGDVWQSLPPAQRANAVIFAYDYGEAGAINELSGGSLRAVSGHDSLWWWGPGNPRATTVVAVAPGPKLVDDYGAQLRRLFLHVRVVATFSRPHGRTTGQSGGHVYVCTRPRRPWGDIWPELRTYRMYDTNATG